jgi:hypothetical protein
MLVTWFHLHRLEQEPRLPFAALSAKRRTADFHRQAVRTRRHLPLDITPVSP